ncbi:MAG: 23S rRNA (guanosine(2251)-2'-O)-methyltransferase RlmB [Anaerolineaceae bacterium]|nr:23S rRNA (guanosine(2251)-2'-O)-methyltransferase RlmB [Anaerolineaceae bacterium]
MNEFIYRRNAIAETILASRRNIVRLLLAKESSSNNKNSLVVASAQIKSVKIERIPRSQITGIIGNSNHQDMLLEVQSYPYAEIEDMYALSAQNNEAPLLLILDQLQSPSNIGRLLRSAEAMRAHGVILQKRRTVGITPAVVAASMGASEHLLIARVTNIARTITQLQGDNLWVIGLDANTESNLLSEMDLNRAITIVIGNEATGIRKLIRNKCDALVSISMLGKIKSLNAAIAGSIALYAAREARNQVD